MIIRKLPDRRLRAPLAGLCLAYLLMSCSDWLVADMLVLLALWYAFETSTTS
jgi:hypothetical protein